MREILFRAKRIDDGEWIEGLLCYNIYSHLSIQPTKEENCCPILMASIGQFTGLTDKNGKKIFEGDIVKGAWNTVFQVVYDDCYLGFRAKEKDGFHNCIDYYGLDRLEVIGNIHDNPQLLKEEGVKYGF